MQTRRLARIALFPVLLAALSWISLPLPFTPVPVTGQTIGVFLTAALLGGRDGALAVLAYLLLGAAGAPVFSFGQGGLGVILGPSGGYLLGFLPGVYFSGLLREAYPAARSLWLAALMLPCLLCYYAAGTMQLALVMNLTCRQALAAGVFPFILPDMVKLFVAVLLAEKIQGFLGKDALPYSKYR